MISRALLSLSFSFLASLSLLACATDEASLPGTDEASPATSQLESESSLLPPSCYDQCYWASLTCTQDCGASASACSDATAICYDSCTRGVGPWLPC
jgi:hypothetical protein